MSDLAENAKTAALPQDRQSESPKDGSAVSIALAVAWLTIPAIQYYATAVRTRFQMGEAGSGQDPPSIVELDLTVVYLLLVLATAMFLALRYLARRPVRTGSAASPKPGGHA